jgi:hypothetical protein
MGMIFPSAMVADIRKAHASGAPIRKREIRFSGGYIGEPRTVPCPGPQTYGKVTVPIWCSCCGKQITEGEGCIEQLYDLYPNDPDRTGSFTSYFHIEKCKHAGGIN